MFNQCFIAVAYALALVGVIAAGVLLVCMFQLLFEQPEVELVEEDVMPERGKGATA